MGDMTEHAELAPLRLEGLGGLRLPRLLGLGLGVRVRVRGRIRTRVTARVRVTSLTLRLGSPP